MIPHSRPLITANDIEAISNQLRSGMLTEGECAKRLERRLADRFGFADAVVVGSGSQALLLALQLRGVGEGRHVILPTLVCPEVLGVIEALRAIPVLTDVNDQFSLDFEDSAFDAANDAVVLWPWLFGIQQDFKPASSSAWPIVLDWAQYLPSTGNITANAYDVAILSFEATKLIAGGEGGAVLVSQHEDAKKLRALKQISGTKYKLNLYPLSDLQAVLIESQLEQLDLFIERRLLLAKKYNDAFAELSNFKPVWQVCATPPFRYVVRLASALNLDQLIEKFEKRGISVRRPVDTMLHRLRPQQRAFPTAEKIFQECLSMPFYPALTDEDISNVISVTKELLA